MTDEEAKSMVNRLPYQQVVQAHELVRDARKYGWTEIGLYVTEGEMPDIYDLMGRRPSDGKATLLVEMEH